MCQPIAASLSDHGLANQYCRIYAQAAAVVAVAFVILLLYSRCSRRCVSPLEFHCFKLPDRFTAIFRSMQPSIDVYHRIKRLMSAECQCALPHNVYKDSTFARILLAALQLIGISYCCKGCLLQHKPLCVCSLVFTNKIVMDVIKEKKVTFSGKGLPCLGAIS